MLWNKSNIAKSQKIIVEALSVDEWDKVLVGKIHSIKYLSNDKH